MRTYNVTGEPLFVSAVRVIQVDHPPRKLSKLNPYHAYHGFNPAFKVRSNKNVGTTCLKLASVKPGSFEPTRFH